METKPIRTVEIRVIEKGVSWLSRIFSAKKSKMAIPTPFTPQSEFVFIWHTKVFTGNKTVMSGKFRSKVIAANYNEALAKARVMAAKKVEIEIFLESEYPKTEMGKAEQIIDDLVENSKLYEKKVKAFWANGYRKFDDFFGNKPY